MSRGKPFDFADKSRITAIFSSSAFALASVRKRLWLGAGAVGLFVVTVYAVYAMSPSRMGGPSRVAGLDFVSFYTAGSAVREGRAEDLYDLNATRKFQGRLEGRDGVAMGKLYAPWWNPPFYALVFVPLSSLNFFSALSVWIAVNVVSAGIAVWMLCRMLPAGTGWRTWGLVPVLVLLSMPFMATMTHGQNSGTSLLLLTLTVYFWRKGRALLAGLIGGLLFYKPQLALVLSGVMLVDLGFVAGIGVAITGLTLLAINLMLLPGTLGAFLHQVPANLHFVQEQSIYPWARHVTPKAMFRVMIQGERIGLTSPVVTVLSYLTGAIFAFLLTRTAFKWCGQRYWRDRLIIATIISTPVIMPFYFDYDLLLLAVPAVLLAVEELREPRFFKTYSPLQKGGTTAVFTILYIALLFNPDIIEAFRINLTAVLLMALCAAVIFRTNLGEMAAEKAELQRIAA